MFRRQPDEDFRKLSSQCTAKFYDFCEVFLVLNAPFLVHFRSWCTKAEWKSGTTLPVLSKEQVKWPFLSNIIIFYPQVSERCVTQQNWCLGNQTHWYQKKLVNIFLSAKSSGRQRKKNSSRSDFNTALLFLWFLGSIVIELILFLSFTDYTYNLSCIMYFSSHSIIAIASLLYTRDLMLRVLTFKRTSQSLLHLI